MRIDELYPDAITEYLDCEYKAVLNVENPVKWAKTMVGFTDGRMGILFVDVSNDASITSN